MVVGHVAPEAFVDGTIGLVHEGDFVTIDAIQLMIKLNVGMLLCFRVTQCFCDPNASFFLLRDPILLHDPGHELMQFEEESVKRRRIANGQRNKYACAA